MLPIIRVPEILAKGMESFRKIFCRGEGFEPICRFITGLILSPNKTLQGIYDLQVWEREAPSRRAMHEAVFESGWDGAAFIQQHRGEVAQAYQGRGRQVISLDWTLAHHERGPKIYAVTKSYDYVERRTGLFQTVVTAVVSNREWIDGLEVVVQDPKDLKAEAASAKRRPNRAMNADFRKPLTLLITQSLQVRRAETLFILHFQWITALEERSWNLPGISPLKP